MKTIQVAIITIAAIILSGCATGYYQRGYVGHGSSYASPGYYRNYERSYANPGTSITFGQYYTQPNYHRDYEHDDHHDWHAPSQNFDRHEGGHGGWQNRDFGRRDFARGYSAQQDTRHGHSGSEQRDGGLSWRNGRGGRYRGRDE